MKHGCGQPVRSAPKQPEQTFETWLASMADFPSSCGGGKSKDSHFLYAICWKEGKHSTTLAPMPVSFILKLEVEAH